MTVEIWAEPSDYTFVLDRSIRLNVGDAAMFLLCDDIEAQLKGSVSKQDRVFLRGDSVKWVTTRFVSKVREVCRQILCPAVGKKYLGSFAKKGFEKAYWWEGIQDVHQQYDDDVIVVPAGVEPVFPDGYGKQLREDKLIEVLPVELNFKDDWLIPNLFENMHLLGWHVNALTKAALVNLSLEAVMANKTINTVVAYPFDELQKYINGRECGIKDVVDEKTETLNRVFKQIRQGKIDYA